MSDSRVTPVPPPDHPAPTTGSARDVPIRIELPAGMDAITEGALRSAVASAVVGSGYTVHVAHHHGAVAVASEGPAVPCLSVVLPVYNESDNLPELARRLGAVLEGLGETYEVIFVDDGSQDATQGILRSLHARDPHMRIVRLSRNFGHQAAISAGIDHARGDVIVIMDADLQDPPEEIPNLLAHWRQGYQVVYAIRHQRQEGLLKRSAYGFFYRSLHQVASIEIPLDAGDFCAIDRQVADVLRSMPERNRFIRGIRSWIGFRQIGVPYNRAARYAGKPKYSLFKLTRLALDGFFSFSYLPLRLASLLGLLVSIAGFFLAVWTIYKRLVLPEFPSGFATIVVGMMFLGGIQLLALGMIGEYVGRIFDEVKQRPIYIVRERWGFDPPNPSPGRTE
jgi:dolichol-phosphate mannosyltransferase